MTMIDVFFANVICHTWVSFNNCVDQILPTFDYLHPQVDSCEDFIYYLPCFQVTKHEHPTDYLLTSFCPHSFLMTPW